MEMRKTSATAPVSPPNDVIMESRLEFVKAIKKSSYCNEKGACDYVPAMELVGIWTASAAVCKMHFEGKLEVGPACLLNTALTLHSFNVWHCCSHNALASGNDEHEAFENMVTRLSSVLIGFADSSVAGHKRHHRYTNTPDDPDLWMQLPLKGMGDVIKDLTAPKQAGAGVEPGAAFEDFALLGFVDRVLSALCAEEDTKELGEALRLTFKGVQPVFFMVLSLFFGRYPHLRGSALQPSNEVDSFYNTTWRGQGQVDLWMMGEGWHHGHHACTDVNYTVLPKVAADVEARHPKIKASFRGNGDLTSLENPDAGMPPHLAPEAEEPCQLGWQRTLAIREGIEKLLAGGDAAEFCRLSAQSAIENALRVVTTADMALLRHLHQEMGLKEADRSSPLSPGSWHETVFSQRTQELLAAHGDNIRAAVASLATEAGAAAAPKVNITEAAGLKGCYLEFFKALGSVFLEEGKVERTLKAVTAAERVEMKQLMARFRSYLEQPLPRDSTRLDELQRPTGEPADIPRVWARVLGTPHSRL